jgi:protein SCO1/2
MPQGKRTIFLIAVVLIGLLVATDCGPSRSAEQTGVKGAEAAGTNQAKDTSVKRYHLTGRVVSVDKPGKSINVDGDEIPGFMAAMTMPYQVKDPSMIDKVVRGDRIKAEIVLADDGAYLENIVVAQKAPSPNPTK